MMNMLYDKSNGAVRMGSPEYDIFTYITYMRMLKDMAFVSVMANPNNKEARSMYSKLVLPQIEEFDRQKKQKTMQRMFEWTSSGPVHIAPLGNVSKIVKDPIF